jgi:hypothetical protein
VWPATQRFQRALPNIDAPNGVTFRHDQKPLSRYRRHPVVRRMPQTLLQCSAPGWLRRGPSPRIPNNCTEKILRSADGTQMLNTLSQRNPPATFILLVVFRLGSKDLRH